jgi:hypothetical protein
MALRMVKNLCLHAVKATFLTFPAARSRSYKALIRGLSRVATRVPLESTVRTCARPPQIVRRPRRVPRAPWRGATPTTVALGWRLRVPNSGSASHNVRAHTGPRPGARWKRSSLSHHRGLARRSVSRSLSSMARRSAASHPLEKRRHRPLIRRQDSAGYQDLHRLPHGACTDRCQAPNGPTQGDRQGAHGHPFGCSAQGMALPIHGDSNGDKWTKSS